MSDEADFTAELLAAEGSAIVRRRTLAWVVAIGSIPIACGVGFAIAWQLEWVRAGFGAGILIALAALRLTIGLTNRPPSMTRSQVRATRGSLTINNEAIDARSLDYQGRDELLWVRGRFGIPQTCLEVTREQALRIGALLQIRERGIRTLTAVPPMVALPVIGFVCTTVVGCFLMFALVMLMFGPTGFGLILTAVAVPLSFLVFRPAVLRVTPDELQWQWWGWRKRVPLRDIDDIVLKPDRLLVRTRDGSTKSLIVRVSTGAAGSVASTEAMGRERLAEFTEFIESAADAAASVPSP